VRVQLVKRLRVAGDGRTAYKANYMNSDCLTTELSKSIKARRESNLVLLRPRKNAADSMRSDSHT
jgi:hypothetical protein